MEIASRHALFANLHNVRSGQDVKLSIENLPANLLGQKIQAKIDQVLQNGFTRLTLGDGRQVLARVEPPLPPGTQLSFTATPDGKIKITQLIPPAIEEGEDGAEQQTGRQNTGQKKSFTQQSAANSSLPKELAQLIRQNVRVQALAGQPLPTLNTRLNGQVISPPENGFQNFQLHHGNTSIRLQLPTPVPPQTQLTIRLNSAVQATILDARANAATPAGQNQPPVTTPQQLQRHTPATTVNLSSGAQNQILQQDILSQIRIIVPLQIKTALINATSHALQNQVIATDTPTGEQRTTTIATAPKNSSPATTAPPLPVNIPMEGQLLPLPQSSSTSQQQGFFRYLLQLPEQPPFEVQSPTPLQGGSKISIRFTSDGMAEVLRIIAPEKTDARHPHTHQDASRQNLRQYPPPSSLRPGSTHTATVIAQGKQGIHTLRLPNNDVFQARSIRPLTVGTQVNIQITPDGHTQITNMTLPGASAKTEALMQFSTRWPGLESALNALQQNHPELAQKLADKLPNLGKNFLPAIISFTEAVSGQQLTKLFGDETLNLLRGLGIDFSADLSTFSQLQQKSDAPETWRTFFFPYVEEDGGNPQQGSFYWRQQGEGEEKNTRLVVNLTLSQLGPVQMDGLVRDKDIQIRLRLHEIPTPSFEKDLQKIIKETLEQLEMTGNIYVEATDYFDVNPLHDLANATNQFNVTI